MEAQAHGVLLEVHGVGVLLRGPSGIGKSECALELIGRGHRLVADDVVRLVARDDGTLVGFAPTLIRHYLEIRGIGLLFIPELYGPDSVLDESPIELICQLAEWQKGADFERVGLERPTEDVLGVAVPRLILPARPAGTTAPLIEVAARDHLQRRRGVSGAQRLDQQLRDRQTRSEDEPDPASDGTPGGARR